MMEDIDIALAAARAGAAVVAGHFGGPTEASYKAADNPVTEVDHAAEQAILEVIRGQRPADEILSEEGGRGAARGRRLWIVDPLDGTVNYMNGIPQVGVSVALYEGNEPLVAVVIDPLRGEEFTAERGQGARLGNESVHVSDRRTLDAAVLGTGFPYDHKQYAGVYSAVVAAVLERVQGVRRMGAAVLDLAWVAAGRYDGFWELGLAPWDLAGGLLLIREAGGTITTPDGEPSTPFHPLVVASNAHVHDDLRSVVARNLPGHLA
jgi:myo-inositol-1(or 4)-monophosphatase